uniref:Uncharacterized protein n=1 Tax=Anguilla anguilla TaxID=7936 RepID=A0A0E9R0P5_ANGAN
MFGKFFFIYFGSVLLNFYICCQIIHMWLKCSFPAFILGVYASVSPCRNDSTFYT